MPTAADSHAAQVCFMCKTRKKRCDKVLPVCGYCRVKGLDCVYGARSSTVDRGGQTPSRRRIVYTNLIPAAIPSDPSPTETNIYLQVHRLIRSTGQFLDDISVRYFQGLHNHLPIISRSRFHNQLITLGSTPAADFSVLLLSLCLVTLPHDIAHPTTSHESPPPTDQPSLRVTARCLFGQVQATYPPSTYLIQAGLWLAIYEYAQGRPDDAFALIACCARMAYTVGLHVSSRQSSKLSSDPKVRPCDTLESLTEIQEAGNTWWGIIIYERIFVCDVTIPEQPLVATISGKHARLPVELETLDHGKGDGDPKEVSILTISSLASLEIRGFGRAAQAAYLSDQVIKALAIECVDSKLIELDALDAALRSFLAVVMQQGHEICGFFCGAIGLAVRALFVLHRHILNQLPITVTAKFKSMSDWHESSYAALDTVTQMVVDIADSHETIGPARLNALPPIYLYIAKAALQHIHEKAGWKDNAELLDAEKRLQSSLERRRRRWHPERD